MEKLILLPVAILLITGLAMELQDIAERASQKTVRFASDVDEAMDCALFGVDIAECSPNLVKNGTGMGEEMEEFRALMEKTQESAEALQRTEVLRVEEGDAFSVAVGSSQYVLKLMRIKDGVAEFEGVSLQKMHEHRNLPFGEGSEELLDVDGDGASDVVMHVLGIGDGFVEVSLQLQKGSVSTLDVSVSALLALLFVVVLLLLSRKRR